LGTPSEILKEKTQSLSLGIESHDAKLLWHLHTEGRSLKIKAIDTLDAKGKKSYSSIDAVNDLLPTSTQISPNVHQLVTQLRQTIYLSAVRLGTTEVFPIPEDPTLVYADVGLQGEFAPWWLLESDSVDIMLARRHASTHSPIPRIQLNAWLSALFPEAEVNVQAVSQTNLTRLELRIGKTEWCRPANVGYGLTYAFPILVAGLLAHPEQILIIDSPEAHLHPMGQSQIGRFLVQMAASGLQIIIETHSDHVLNGIRLALRDGVIAPEKTQIHFFTPSKDTHVISPQVDAQGNLSEYPMGFFDQAEKDLATLAGWI
jgi:predicted ATPase